MSAESGLPPVDPEVLDRAAPVLAAHYEHEIDAEYGGIICSECGFSFGESPIGPEERQRHALQSVAPVIAAAAYRQGREDLEARIEELAEDHEIKASITESDRKARELDRRAELLRSLLTDKEEGVAKDVSR